MAVRGLGGAAVHVREREEPVPVHARRHDLAARRVDVHGTLELFFGSGLFDSLDPATRPLLATYYTAATTRAFVLAGTSHTMLGQLGSITGPAPANVELAACVRQWAAGDPAGSTVP